MTGRVPWRGIALGVVAVVIVAGFYLVLNDDDGPGQPAPPPAVWVYAINGADIEEVIVRHGASRERYFKVDQDWFLNRDGESQLVAPDRWGAGVPLLLSGPSANRVLNVSEGVLGEYGLASPAGEIGMLLRGDRRMRVLVGDLTPDGKQHYVRLAGRMEVSLVPTSWADLLLALATDPAVS